MSVPDLVVAFCFSGLVQVHRRQDSHPSVKPIEGRYLHRCDVRRAAVASILGPHTSGWQHTCAERRFRQLAGREVRKIALESQKYRTVMRPW